MITTISCPKCLEPVKIVVHDNAVSSQVKCFGCGETIIISAEPEVLKVIPPSWSDELPGPREDRAKPRMVF